MEFGFYAQTSNGLRAVTCVCCQT